MIVLPVIHRFVSFWIKAMSTQSTAYNLVKQENQFVRLSTSTTQANESKDIHCCGDK
ncbi:hypothetical protein HII17_09280 [Thalassotalea sp. M1531]|uniref:Uncharacterized protein n=1 Tax=Thalassotalea algicola TaxID=2716224 RepID=A0A7Y0LCM3_9GAMM|nr:hypothetical protein [Thalassotalea algicola]NMP31754.1 hypothetical protein [Thalassotalea algicola]